MGKNESTTALENSANAEASVENSSVVTRDAQIDGTPTRSKKDCFLATLSRLEKSSFEPFRELVEAIHVWIEAQASDMHRGQPRINALAEFVTAEFLYSDAMLQKRSKIPYTLILSAIKLFTSIPIDEGPAHPVKKHCAQLLYSNDKVEYAFASSQIERHEAISESEMRKIFKRNEDSMTRLSEEGIIVSPAKQSTERSVNESEEKIPNVSSLRPVPTLTKTNVYNMNAAVDSDLIKVSDIVANLSKARAAGNDCDESRNHGNEDNGNGNDKDGTDGDEPDDLPRVNAGNPGDPDDDPDSSSSEDDVPWNRDDRNHRHKKDAYRNRNKDKDEYNREKRISSFMQTFKNKKAKFTGEFEEAWIEYETDYRLAAKDLQIDEEDQLRLLHNLLDGEARRTYLRNVVSKANTFEEATQMMRDIYDTPAVQARITNMLNMLKFDDCIDYSVEPEKQEVDALYKLHHKISTLAPQGSVLYREDGHKVEYMRRAVLGKPWASQPCSQISALQLKYIDLYQMLKESLQHHIEERKATETKAPKKVYHTTEAQKSLTPDKYGKITGDRRPKPSHWRKGYIKKRSNDCHTCGRKWNKGHVCIEEEAIAHTKKKIAQRKANAALLQMIAHAATADDHGSDSSDSDGSEDSQTEGSESHSDQDIPEDIFETMFQNKMKHILKSQKH